MKKNIIINDFSGGRTGKFGQFSSPGVNYTQEMTNLIPNRGGSLRTRPGTESLGIKLLKHDKALPFRFREENYILVYDTLLKREWKNAYNSDGTALNPNVSHHSRLSYSRSDFFGAHRTLQKFLNLSFGPRDDYLLFIHRYAVDSGLVVIPIDVDFTKNIYAGATTAPDNTVAKRFLEAVTHIGIDCKNDSLFWNRFLIYKEDGTLVSTVVKRPFYTDEDSGHEILNDSDGNPYEVPVDITTRPETYFSTKELFAAGFTDLQDLREKMWGGSGLSYEAVSSTEEVMFTDPTGTLPPMVWRPLELPQVVYDLRALYHRDLSGDYYLPSYLTIVEAAQQPDLDTLLRITIGRSVTYKAETISPLYPINSYNSPFVKPNKGPSSEGKESRGTDVPITGVGMELAVRPEWSFLESPEPDWVITPEQMDAYRMNQESINGGMVVMWNGMVAIAPEEFFYVGAKETSGRVGTSGVRNPPVGKWIPKLTVSEWIYLTGYKADINGISPDDVSYTSWRIFLSRGKRIGELEVETIGGVVTPKETEETFIVGERVNDMTLDTAAKDRVITRGMFFYKMYFQKKDGISEFVKTRTIVPENLPAENVPGQAIFGGKAVNGAFPVMAEPFGYDIVIPTTNSFSPIEQELTKAGGSDFLDYTKLTFFQDLGYGRTIPSRSQPPRTVLFTEKRWQPILCPGANKGKYWKYSEAVFGRIILSSYKGKEGVLAFTSNDSEGKRLDFSPLDLFVAKSKNPPDPVQKLGAREEITSEGGISIHWIKAFSNRLRIGTSQGLLTLSSLHSGSLFSTSATAYDTTVFSLYPIVITQGNEYFLSSDKKEVFYNRYSESYKSSRQFSIGHPLKVDVLALNEITNFVGLERDGYLFMVVNGAIYMGVVDDAKKDNEVAWCKFNFSGKRVVSCHAVGQEVFIGLQGVGVVKFSPSSNVVWETTDIGAFLEFTAPFVYMILSKDFDLGVAPEFTKMLKLKVFGSISDKSLVSLGDEDEVTYLPREVEGVYVDDISSNLTTATKGVKLGIKKQNDVIDLVIFSLEA